MSSQARSRLLRRGAATEAAGPEVAVLPIHFEDRSGTEFERLCLAFLIHTQEWKSIDWYGQLGSDGGRDIWGVHLDGSTHCFACANYQRLAFRKATDDLAKLASRLNGVPDRFTLVCGGRVSAQMKSKIVLEARRHGIRDAEVWAGTEFEERIRAGAPGLIQRFVEGIAFPGSADLLRALSPRNPLDDTEMLALMAECFDRPAFTTPFHEESSIPDFRKAITDTIEALNTGVRRLRDGTEIGRIPRRSLLQEPENRIVMARVVDHLVKLRTAFEALSATDDIRECCGGSCGTVFSSHRAARTMDRLRSELFQDLAKVVPTGILPAPFLR